MSLFRARMRSTAVLLLQAMFLVCTKSLTDEMIGLRLVGGKNFYSGRLEVFYDGEWGTICDDGWSELSADVACRTLGFDGYATGYMPVKDVPLNNISVIWLSYVQCSGRESRFFECIEEEQWGVENCEHTEDVGVVCYFPPPADIPSLPLRVFCPDDYSGGNCTECGDAFLYDQSSCSSSPEVSGFVQVYYGGEWKFVDGSEWGEEEAFVFCGNIGYPRNFANPTAEKLLGCDPSTNASCLTSELKKELDSPIMYGLDCEGHESMLKDCFFTHWTQSTYIRNWKPGKYATVQCGFGPGQACNSTSKVGHVQYVHVCLISTYIGVGSSIPVVQTIMQTTHLVLCSQTCHSEQLPLEVEWSHHYSCGGLWVTCHVSGANLRS